VTGCCLHPPNLLNWLQRISNNSPGCFGKA
jgi:hypothetical protein